MPVGNIRVSYAATKMPRMQLTRAAKKSTFFRVNHTNKIRESTLLEMSSPVSFLGIIPTVDRMLFALLPRM